MVDKIKKILAICPTRERPDKCRQMMESFNKTKHGNIDLMFSLDLDDPCLADYLDLFEGRQGFYLLERMTITEIFNHVALELEPNYDVYHTTNDDFIYRTEGFDDIITASIESNGSGVYHGNDGHWGSDLAVAPFITKDLVQALGWLQMPKLIHLCSDTVWTLLADLLGCLHYLPEIDIEHIHPETKGVPKDSISERVNSPAMYNKDYMAFFLWKQRSMASDLQKCREVLDGGVGLRPKKQ